MAFDIVAAKKAGASEDQILQYLTQTRTYDISGAMKAGATKAQVIDYLSNSQAPKQTVTPELSTKDSIDTGIQNIVKDITGQVPNKSESIIPNIVQNTVGSKGLAGVAQLPGKAAAAVSEYAPFIGKNQEESLNTKASEIFNHATELLVQARKETDPAKQNQLRINARELIKSAEGLQKNAGDISQYTDTTGGQAIGTAANAALTAATVGTGGVAGSLKGAVGVAARAAEGAATGIGFQAAANLTNQKPIQEDIGKAAIIGGAIPIAGAILSKSKELLGRAFEGIGNKIEGSLIKPSQADIKDGFKIANLQKYKVGGNLSTILNKTSVKLDELSQELNTKLAGSTEKININDIISETEKSLTKNKLKTFGDNKRIASVLDTLKQEASEILPTGEASIPEAQLIKQAAGTKGAWVFGNTDPDAKASEVIYNTFYRNLKTAIEQKSPAGIKEINKQISELIPIRHAVLRRIPVEARNSAISLTDSIGLIASAIDPKALGVTALQRVLKSGTIGNTLAKTGGTIKKATGLTKVGKKVFGR